MESACAEIIRLAEKVMDGGEITQEEAKSLIRTKDEDTMLLLAMADKIRQKFNGNAVDFCAIINARSGHCQENCKFCAQSGWYHTGAKVYRLLPEEEILAAAKKAKEAGAVRFSLVTSGRNQDNPNEFDEIIDIVKKIREQVGIEVCCSLGLISKEQALQLKEAGITRIHCNIETSLPISRRSARRIRWRIRRISSIPRSRQGSACAPAGSSGSGSLWISGWRWPST